MKKTIFILFLLLTCIAYSQKKKCADFKVGKFTYTDPNYKNWRVTRNAKEQIEVDKVNKTVLKAAIHWVTDCEYTLTYTSVNDSKKHKIVGQKVKVKIIKIANNRITCESEGQGTKLRLEMVLQK